MANKEKADIDALPSAWLGLFLLNRILRESLAQLYNLD